MQMLYQDITEKILACCFEVSNELGSGFLESVYEKALLIVLKEKGLNSENQVPINVIFRGELIGEFFSDILVENKVIIEIKSVNQLKNEHQAQLIHYLKATGIKVGLLVNFGKPKLEYRRLYN
jgi:GxxExxY protein